MINQLILTGVIKFMKQTKHYVTKEEMREELIKLKETNVFSHKLHMIFYEMSYRIANKGRFYSYTWKEDMITEAYLRCVKYAKVFDTTRDNPFGYFTTAIYRCYFKYREVELNYQDKKWVELSNYASMMENEHSIKLEFPEDIKHKMYKATATEIEIDEEELECDESTLTPEEDII